MRLANDYIHPTARGDRCRVRIFEPEDPSDAPVVVCTRPRGSIHTLPIAEMPERVAAEVLLYLRLPFPLIWIEHFEHGVAYEEDPATFWLVHIDSYELKNDWRGERMVLQGITQRPLDRVSVEALVGRRID